MKFHHSLGKNGKHMRNLIVIGHPNEEKFYFCGRKPEGEFPYCKLHVLYAFQPKGSKEEVLEKGDEVPEFIEKKVKSAG